MEEDLEKGEAVTTERGVRRAAPKSAAPLLDRRRKTKNGRGRTQSATNFREILPLAVCGVGPSRGLELSTPAPSRPATTRSRDSHVNHLQGATAGYLRSGQLYPLGVVDNPPLLPHQCLGIIPSSQRTEARKRPDAQFSSEKIEIERKREIQLSGFEGEKSRHFSSLNRDSSIGGGYERRSRSISLPRDTALVPTSSRTVDLAPEKHGQKSEVKHKTPHLPTFQPAADKEREQEIRVVEVKQSHHYRHLYHKGGEESSTFPNILEPNSVTVQQHKITKPSKMEADFESESDRNKKISIVSFGTEGGRGGRGRKRQAGHRQRRWTLPTRREGQLSYGWTQTQPLSHLTGIPLLHSMTNTRTLDVPSNRETMGPPGLMSSREDSTISRDYITIDVQEYLSNVQQ